MTAPTVGADDRIEHARKLYEDAVFGGDGGALATADRTLDAVRRRHCWRRRDSSEQYGGTVTNSGPSELPASRCDVA